VNELEQRWRDLGEFIREQRRVGQLSLRKLSEMAGISNPYLSQIERGLRKPSAEILQQIARALHISAETLYVRAGILDERELHVDVTGEIRRDPWLSEEQKKTLVHIYETFRSEREAEGITVASFTADEVVDPAEVDPAGEGQRPMDEQESLGTGRG
jgi:transcriptional regulator with XRE-family HTH domain